MNILCIVPNVLYIWGKRRLRLGNMPLSVTLKKELKLSLQTRCVFLKTIVVTLFYSIYEPWNVRILTSWYYNFRSWIINWKRLVLMFLYFIEHRKIGIATEFSNLFCVEPCLSSLFFCLYSHTRTCLCKLSIYQVIHHALLYT